MKNTQDSLKQTMCCKNYAKKDTQTMNNTTQKRNKKVKLNR